MIYEILENLDDGMNGENNGNMRAFSCSLMVNRGVVIFYLQPKLSSPQGEMVLHLIAESRFAPVRSAFLQFE